MSNVSASVMFQHGLKSKVRVMMQCSSEGDHPHAYYDRKSHDDHQC
jgi:hypothetical protein